jgi:hypothetical protein
VTLSVSGGSLPPCFCANVTQPELSLQNTHSIMF